MSNTNNCKIYLQDVRLLLFFLEIMLEDFGCLRATKCSCWLCNNQAKNIL